MSLFLATNRAKYLRPVYSADPNRAPVHVWDLSNDVEGGGLNHFLTVTGTFEVAGSSFCAWAEYSAQQAYLDAFFSSRSKGPSSVTVFVHGYNMDFRSAVERLNRVSSSLGGAGYAGAVMGYDWPSAGGVLLYTRDRANAEASVGPFFGFLEGLHAACKTTGARLNLVCHSMGNLLTALAGKTMLWQDWTVEPWVDQLVMLAPDVSGTLFDTGAGGEVEDPRGAGLKAMCREVTILYNPSDSALAASEHLEHPDESRLGRVGPAGKLPAGITAVDASKTPLRVRKHGDYFLKGPLGFWAGLLR